ncbi:hypothetical protein C3L33_23049, partial [Rhododendron williamsianum]
MFFCEVPPPEGGETPIGPSCRVAQRMMEEFPEAVKEMEEKGLKYTFMAPPQAASTCTGRSWPEIFGSPDPAEAVKKYRRGVATGRKRTFDSGPAAFNDGVRGKKGKKGVVQLDPLMYNKKVASVTMMDGTEIPEKIIKHAARAPLLATTCKAKRKQYWNATAYKTRMHANHTTHSARKPNMMSSSTKGGEKKRHHRRPRDELRWTSTKQEGPKT